MEPTENTTIAPVTPAEAERLAWMGKIWEAANGRHRRLYIRRSLMREIVGLELEYYRTGNISWAQLDGALISNCRASRILAAMESPACYYDLNTREMKGADSFDPNEYLSKAVEAELAEKTEGK